MVLVTPVLGQHSKPFSSKSYPMEGLVPTYTPVCPAGGKPGTCVPKAGHMARVAQRTQTAQIDVFYEGFENFPEAQDAFQFAVDIWASLIESPIPIRVRATFEPLTGSTLGAAGPTSVWRNFDNAPLLDTWYPVALAEKMARVQINDPAAFDIEASFNSDTTKVDWYFDTADPLGIAGTDKQDFATVVLHELCHGLGFFSLASEQEFPEGSGTFVGNISPTPYSNFIQTSGGDKLDSDFESFTTQLHDALTGDDLFYIAATSNIQIHAPSNFSSGSSIAHVDLANNELMRPQLPAETFYHDPGNALNMVYDFGWDFTYILHDPLESTEDFNQSFVITADVFADSEFDTASVMLHYSTDGFASEDIVIDMDTVSNATEYIATIPMPSAGTTFSYYLTATDTTGRVFTDPGEAPGLAFFQFTAAVDTEGPEITHTPLDTLLETKKKLELGATIQDNQMGIDTVYVEYRINGVDQPAVGLITDPANDEILLKPIGARISLYSDTIDIPGIEGGDQISYRIVAQDKAAAQNISTDPATGFHTFTVTGLPEPITEYGNDFNDITGPFTDFVGPDFSIAQPVGFTDPAIHSIHPYEEALDDREIFYNYQLAKPLIIQAELSTVRFDEVVLVEPGQGLFGGEDFWDFVAIQFSKDFGETWDNFFDGYDSRTEVEWLDRWNEGLSGINSTSTGFQGLYRERSFDMVSHPDIQVGDTILFRFHLFSDQFAAGWGWAIDNLYIQTEPPTAIEDYFSSESSFVVYPNPSASGQFNVRASLIKDPGEVQLRIVNLMGQTVYQEVIPTGSLSLDHRIDLQDYPAGVYVVHGQFGDGQITRKVVKAR